MLEFIRQRKLKIIAVLMTTLVVAFAGYYFAAKKSEPYYEKKIDKIMFDTKNKSPKYVITLPDRNKVRKSKEAETPKQEEKVTVENLAKVIPLVAKLTPLSNMEKSRVTALDTQLVQEENGMLLPKISEKGKKPWTTYANEISVQPNYYKVALVIKNLGQDISLTQASIQSLPSEVSLSFSPYGFETDEDIYKARMSGHETYADLLLPSKDYLKSDTGPLSLDLTSSVEQNKQKYLQTLNRKSPVGGIVINDGVADKDNREQLQVILKDMEARGILLIDATSGDEISSIKTQNLARKKADIVLDDNFSKDNIRAALAKAEEIAMENGNVLVVMSPKPVVLVEVSEWIKSFSPQLTYEEAKNRTIDKPFALVPVSNLVVE